MMWTPHGEPLFNMNDLMNYMFDRFKEQGQKDSPLIIVSLVKYQDKRKAKENEYQGDADASESSEVGILPESGNYHQFMGLKLKTHGLSKNELYNENSKMLKSAMLKHNEKWTNKQQAEWLKYSKDKQDNINLEKIFKMDAQENYPSSNREYREKIGKKSRIFNTARTKP